MSPLSGDRAKRGRQLANLQRGQAPVGNRRSVTHGGYAAVARDRLDARERDVFDALSEDAPLRAGDGSLPAADAALVRLLAEVLCRLDDLAADVREHGWKDRKTGAPRPVLELEGRLRREAADYLDALGCTPRSRARLGLDVVRGFDLAAHWAAQDDREGGDRGGS